MMSAGKRPSRKRVRKTCQEESLDISDDFQEAATRFRLPKRLLVSKSQENPKKNIQKRDTQETSSSCRKTSSERNFNLSQRDSNSVNPERAKRDTEQTSASCRKTSSSERNFNLSQWDSNSVNPERPKRDTEQTSSCRKTSSERNSNVPQPDPSPVNPESETLLENSDLQEIEKSLCAESEKLCPSCKLIVPCNVFADHFKECLQKYKLIKNGHVKQLPVLGKEGKTSEQEKQQPVLPCPVCKKEFKSRTQRIIHIKMCAQNNGLTSEQLLLASRLLEKQHEEWNELGLPTPLQVHPTVAKARSSKYERNIKDPDIAMAVALSRSIADKEMESRLSREEKLFALGLGNIIEEDRKVSPVLLPPPDSVSANRPKKRGRDRKGRHQFQTSLLATRSVGERERLISEKVAVILTSEDTSRSGWQHSKTKERSGNLSSVTSKECQLWEIAKGSANEPLQNFYVHELQQYIQVKEATIGNLLRKLSQVPGRLNTTSLHGLDEESESECEMEEGTSIEEFCTQMALAGLLGSQDDLDITTEMEWEQAAEGTGSQGFITSSLGNKTQYNSDSKLESKVGGSNADIVEALESNQSDLVEVYNAEEDCVILKENLNLNRSQTTEKQDISQATKGTLESVISGQPLSTESCELEKENSHSENITTDCPSSFKEKGENQNNEQLIDVPLQQQNFNNKAIINNISGSFMCTNSNAEEHEDTKKQSENSPLLSSECGKDNVYTAPARQCYKYIDEGLEASGTGSKSKYLMSLSGREESNSSSKARVVPEHKVITSPLKEEAVSKNQDSNFINECMIQTLIQNWNDLLKSGIGSDVTITTLEGSLVKAHSLVLMARCPQLYKESEVHGKVIEWYKVPQETAQQFLSYLYTGSCEITTPGDPLWIELYDIGLKYDCKDLVSYMELLYKAKKSPVKNKLPVLHSEIDGGSLPLGKELEISVEKSTAMNADKNFNVEVMKRTKHDDEKVHEQIESSYVNKISQVNLKSGHEKQDKVENQEEFQRVQSPDLFDDFPCAEKNYIISPVQISPPAKVIPHNFSGMEIDQLEPEESNGVSNIPLQRSSPCKSGLSLGDREDKETLPDSSFEGNPDIPDARSINTESKAKSSLSPGYDKSEIGDDDDVIDLTQSGSKCNSEEYVLDLPSVSNCQPETECHNSTEKVGSTGNENEELMNCESGSDTYKHYISTIWDDFDPVTEELHSNFDKLAANNDDKNIINEPDLHLSIHTQSTSHKLKPTYSSNGDHQKEKHNDSDVPTKETRFAVSPQAGTETSFVEFLEGHSYDEIFVNAAREIEELDGVSESRNQTKSTSSTTASASYSLLSTPHQNRNAVKKRVTPKPDYSRMKSPELKKELQKFGICALGRKKAVAVLQHVYEQTHPLVTDSEAESSFSQTPMKNSVMAVDGPNVQKIQVKTNRRAGSSPKKQNSKKNSLVEKKVGNKCNTAVHETERGPEEEEEDHLNSSFTSTSSSGSSDGGIFGGVASSDADEEILSSTQQAGLVNQVQEVLTSRTDLYRKVLLYEPIFVEDLHAMLKAKKIKCSMQALLDVLDDLCVIVRTQASQKNRGRTKSSKRRRITSPSKNSHEEIT